MGIFGNLKKYVIRTVPSLTALLRYNDSTYRKAGNVGLQLEQWEDGRWINTSAAILMNFHA